MSEDKLRLVAKIMRDYDWNEYWWKPVDEAADHIDCLHRMISMMIDELRRTTEFETYPQSLVFDTFYAKASKND